MKLALRVLSILLLVIGLAISAAITLAALEVRKVSYEPIDHQETLGVSGLTIMIKFRIYNNASYVALKGSSIAIEIALENGTVLAKDSETFDLAPGEYRDIELEVALTNQQILSLWNSSELSLYLRIVFKATAVFRSFPLLSYTLTSSSPIEKYEA